MGLSELFWGMTQIRLERPISGKLMKFAWNWFSDLIWQNPRIRSENQISGKNDLQILPQTITKNGPPKMTQHIDVIQEDK